MQIRTNDAQAKEFRQSQCGMIDPSSVKTGAGPTGVSTPYLQSRYPVCITFNLSKYCINVLIARLSQNYDLLPLSTRVVLIVFLI